MAKKQSTRRAQSGQGETLWASLRRGGRGLMMPAAFYNANRNTYRLAWKKQKLLGLQPRSLSRAVISALKTKGRFHHSHPATVRQVFLTWILFLHAFFWQKTKGLRNQKISALKPAICMQCFAIMPATRITAGRHNVLSPEGSDAALQVWKSICGSS